MVFRNHERMAARKRVDIQERKNAGRFVEFEGRDLSCSITINFQLRVACRVRLRAFIFDSVLGNGREEELGASLLTLDDLAENASCV